MTIFPDFFIINNKLLLVFIAEELEALHCCIQSHKSCPEFWLRLGLCYAGLFKIDLPGCSLLRSNLEDQEPCCAFNTKSSHESSGEQNGSSLPASSECAMPSSSSLATSSSSHCSNNSSDKENENTLKCEVCTLGVQIVSSCLIHTKYVLFFFLSVLCCREEMYR